MLEEMELLIKDGKCLYRSATGLTMFLTSELCAFIFIVFSFTPLSNEVEIDDYQIAAVIALCIAFLGFLFVSDLVMTFEEPETYGESNPHEEQNIYDGLKTYVLHRTNEIKCDDLQEECNDEGEVSLIVASYVPSPSYPKNVDKKFKRINCLRPLIVYYFVEISGKNTWIAEIEAVVAYEVLRAQGLMEGHMSMLREASRGVDLLLSVT